MIYRRCRRCSFCYDSDYCLKLETYIGDIRECDCDSLMEDGVVDLGEYMPDDMSVVDVRSDDYTIGYMADRGLCRV